MSNDSQAAEYLGGSPLSDQILRESNYLSIPQEGQIQDFIAKILIDNQALDIFHVNLASNNTNSTNSSTAILDTEQLLWIHNDSFSLNIDLYQQGTDKNVGGDCGQMQANTEGTVDFDSNDCLTELKALCMRETGSGITVSENQRRRRKGAKKEELVARKRLNKWRKRIRDKLKRSVETRDSKCLLWRDLTLPGGIYLGNMEWNSRYFKKIYLFHFQDKFALKRINLCLLRKRTGFVR